jgi:hypothetical protein
MVVQLQTNAISPGSIVQALPRMDPGRLRAYRENLEFYQGRQWLEPQRRRDRRLILNYAKTVVEKTASYTMSGLSFVVDPGEGQARQRRGPGGPRQRCARCTKRTASSSSTSTMRSTARCSATRRTR